jgi:hypothetical protein
VWGRGVPRSVEQEGKESQALEHFPDYGPPDSEQVPRIQVGDPFPLPYFCSLAFSEPLL